MSFSLNQIIKKKFHPIKELQFQNIHNIKQNTNEANYLEKYDVLIIMSDLITINSIMCKKFLLCLMIDKWNHTFQWTNSTLTCYYYQI